MRYRPAITAAVAAFALLPNAVWQVGQAHEAVLAPADTVKHPSHEGRRERSSAGRTGRPDYNNDADTYTPGLGRLY